MLARGVSTFSLPASCATNDVFDEFVDLELPSDVESECLLPSDVEDNDIMQDLCSNPRNVRRKLHFSSDSLLCDTWNVRRKYFALFGLDRARGDMCICFAPVAFCSHLHAKDSQQQNMKVVSQQSKPTMKVAKKVSQRSKPMKVLKPMKAKKVLPAKKLSKKELEAQQALEKKKEFSQKIHAALNTVGSQDDVLEIFSRPRLAPVAVSMGMKASWSLDLVCGWDALNPSDVKVAKTLQERVMPKFIMASPPCTMFSALMKLWNFKKMKALVRILRQADADSMVDTAVESCLTQHRQGRLFAFEHPATASSWKEHKKLVAGLKQRGTFTVVYDQCATGLKSPSGQPMKKRTRLWTNSPAIVRRFKKFQCQCKVPHKRICGAENGHKLSVWAQCYPKKMINNLLQGAAEDMWGVATFCNLRS